jgi:hypothetical protein
MPKSLNFVSWGYFQRLEKNTLYVLQVDTKTKLVIVVATIKVEQMGTKGRGRVQPILLPLLSQQTLLQHL